MSIPFLNLEEMHKPIKEEMIQAFSKVYDSNWFVLGKEVSSFESAFANFIGVQYCVGTSNGLDALFLGLRALGIGSGDEVIVPSNTYIASALAITYTGATPIFVEPDPETYNIDPAKIQKAINERTKAIMPVHLYGQACEMTPILDVARNNDLFIIEDNAQAQGASFNGKNTGSWGDINATSFYPGKNLGALGDAGSITTNSAELADKANTLRNYGSRVKYLNEEIGHNMRLDELQAAFLSIKLKNLWSWTEQRQTIASWYNDSLDGIAELFLPKVANGATHVYHLYVVRCEKRDELQTFLKENGVGTLIHYPIPPHLQKAYEPLGLKRGDFPIAETLASTSLSLPLWPGMKKEQVYTVSRIVKEFFGK